MQKIGSMIIPFSAGFYTAMTYPHWKNLLYSIIGLIIFSLAISFIIFILKTWGIKLVR